MARYVLADTPDNPQTATVDDHTLERGGDPVGLNEKQAKRLEEAGVELEKSNESGS